MRFAIFPPIGGKDGVRWSPYFDDGFDLAVSAYRVALDRFDAGQPIATAAEIAESSGESVGVWLTAEPEGGT